MHRHPLAAPAPADAPAVPESHPAAPSRVLFYGMTGSGKSSAARAYAEATGLPEFSADDDIGWLPGWKQRTDEEQRDIAAGIAAQDRWVLDSAYGIWRDVVLPRAELVVGLDYPRWLSLARLVRRSLRRAITREAVCNGNRETLARLFIDDSIIRWHFRSFTRKRQVMRELQGQPRDASGDPVPPSPAARRLAGAISGQGPPGRKPLMQLAKPVTTLDHG